MGPQRQELPKITSGEGKYTQESKSTFLLLQPRAAASFLSMSWTIPPLLTYFLKISYSDQYYFKLYHRKWRPFYLTKYKQEAKQKDTYSRSWRPWLSLLAFTALLFTVTQLTALLSIKQKTSATEFQISNEGHHPWHVYSEASPSLLGAFRNIGSNPKTGLLRYQLVALVPVVSVVFDVWGPPATLAQNAGLQQHSVASFPVCE